MADPASTSASTLNPGILSLLQSLGLAGYLNGGTGGPTVAGQPETFDQGAITLNNTGAAGQGGYSDQALQGSAMPQNWNFDGGGFARGGQQQQSGYGMVTSTGGNGTWYPTSDAAASDFSNAQVAYNQNQANSIQSLLNQLTGSSAEAPAQPDLATSLSSSSPNRGSTVVNGPGNGFTAPAAAQIPGLAAMQAQAFNQQQAPPQMPSAPVSAQGGMGGGMGMGRGTPTGPATLGGQLQGGGLTQQQIIAQGGPLQASSGSGIPANSLNRSSPVVIPPNQGAAVPPFSPAGTPQYSPPSAPTTNVGTTIGNGVSQIGKAFQTYQQNQQGVQSGVSLRNYSPSSTGDPDPDSNYVDPSGAYQGSLNYANSPMTSSAADPDPDSNYLDASGADTGAGAAAGGGLGAGAGSAIGGAITAIGNALKPTFIPNTVGDASTVLNPAYFKPINFRPPIVQAQPMT
jgi:hypothetical protein